MKTTEEKNYLATCYFENIILNSWTYARMTIEEQTRLLMWMYRVFEGKDCYRLTGTAEQRKKQVILLYNTFLQGLGYNGPFWREPADAEPLPF